jgi:hypothetical protein
LTFSERLDPSQGPSGRAAWHRRALQALAPTAVVFADPDNGLRAAAGRGKLHKYALLSELADYARRRQSLVVYHHADRSARAESQARTRLEQLAEGVGQSPVAALVARRGSCRFFLVTAAGPRREALGLALASFCARWSPHVEMAGP